EGEVLIRASVRGRAAQPARGAREQRGRPRDGRPQDSRRQRGGQPGRGRGNVARQAVSRPSTPPPPRQPSAATDEETIALESASKDVVRELLSLMDIPADVMAVDNPSVMELSSDDPPTVFI